MRQSTLDKRLIRSAESFENTLTSEMGSIPPSLLARAQGILIFRQYGAGMGIGGRGGFGVAMARQNDGRWSPPAFLKSGEGSIGFQIGVQRLDMVYLFMSRDSMKLFNRGKFRIGVDAAAVAGPVGGNAEGKVGAPILVYSDNAGLYAGVKFEGGFLLADDEANSEYYRSGITIQEILYGNSLAYPPAAQSLRGVLEKHEALDRKNKAWGFGENNSGSWWSPKTPQTTPKEDSNNHSNSRARW